MTPEKPSSQERRRRAFARVAEIEWDRRADTPESAYDGICGCRTETEVIDRGRDLVAYFRGSVRPDDVVLDMGCGVGHVDKHLAPLCREVHAVDISAKMLQLAERHLSGVPNVRLGKLNSLDLSDFSNGQFDLSICLNVLHHMEREYAVHVLEELRRVTKSGSRLCISVLNFLHPDSLRDWFDYKDQHVVLRKTRNRPFVLQEIEAIVARLGFKILDRDVGRGILFLLENP